MKIVGIHELLRIGKKGSVIPWRTKLPRFVVLHHQVGAGFARVDQSHFDWMFETATQLKTWATEPFELDAPLVLLKAELLADHRNVYLDFEGDLGANRGSVSRVIHGNYQTIENSPQRFSAELHWQSPHQWLIQRKLLIEWLDDGANGSWRLRLSD